MTSVLQEGDNAPDFTLPCDTFEDFTLSANKGKIIVLYFYPKDNTPGCTQQAIEFTELMEEFKAANAVVVGMSKDDPESHQSFKKKQCIGFPLVSDIDVTAMDDYGVWAEKNMYGKKYMGIERSTFLIDQKGVIRKIWRKVSLKGHVKEVLEEVKKIA
ncbi:MAG: bcp [Rickettsiaceae bacterium]|jgi:peroxiredoxin Q/BCP|nr:bcp [Rickettsiaceae bacterium]